MSYLLARQRERINELERMLSNLIDEKKALEEELKRLEARVDFLERQPKELMAEEPTPKRYTEEDWLVLQEAKDLLDELETEEKQDEI